MPTSNMTQFHRALEQLRKESLKGLRDTDRLATMIAEFGLLYESPDVPYSIFNGWQEYRRKERGPGLCQHPVQLAKMLIDVSYYRINSYCEIGVLNGYSIAIISEYLRRFNPDMHVTGVDIIGDIDTEVSELVKFDFVLGTSDDVKGSQFDLVLIDGDHSYEWAKRDYENIGKYAGICAFHDIHACMYVPDYDIPAYWNKIKSDYHYKEFSYCVGPPVMGIGVIYQNPKRRSEYYLKFGINKNETEEEEEEDE